MKDAKDRKKETEASDARARELTARYLERTGIPQKYGMSGERALDFARDFATAARMIAETQARLRTSH